MERKQYSIGTSPPASAASRVAQVAEGLLDRLGHRAAAHAKARIVELTASGDHPAVLFWRAVLHACTVAPGGFTANPR